MKWLSLSIFRLVDRTHARATVDFVREKRLCRSRHSRGSTPVVLELHISYFCMVCILVAFFQFLSAFFDTERGIVSPIWPVYSADCYPAERLRPGKNLQMPVFKAIRSSPHMSVGREGWGADRGIHILEITAYILRIWWLSAFHYWMKRWACA